MALHVHDQFDGVAADLLTRSGSIGATWTRHPAYADVPANQTTWHVDGSGRAYTSAGGYTKCIYLASGTPADAEFDIRTSARFFSTNESGYYGVCFRLNATADTCWRLVYETYGAPFMWSLQVVSAGDFTKIQDYAESPAANADRAVLIRVRNTGIEVLIDGVARISGTNALVTGGDRIGLFGTGANSSTATTGVHFDHLAVGTVGFELPASASILPFHGGHLSGGLL